jgi:phosphate/sulfate permease
MNKENTKEVAAAGTCATIGAGAAVGVAAVIGAPVTVTLALVGGAIGCIAGAIFSASRSEK